MFLKGFLQMRVSDILVADDAVFEGFELRFSLLSSPLACFQLSPYSRFFRGATLPLTVHSSNLDGGIWLPLPPN